MESSYFSHRNPALTPSAFRARMGQWQHVGIVPDGLTGLGVTDTVWARLERAQRALLLTSALLLPPLTYGDGRRRAICGPHPRLVLHAGNEGSGARAQIVWSRDLDAAAPGDHGDWSAGILREAPDEPEWLGGRLCLDPRYKWLGGAEAAVVRRRVRELDHHLGPPPDTASEWRWPLADLERLEAWLSPRRVQAALQALLTHPRRDVRLTALTLRVAQHRAQGAPAPSAGPRARAGRP